MGTETASTSTRLHALVIRFWRATVDRFVIWRYCEAGLTWGDADSYSFMGDPDPCGLLNFRLVRWELIYRGLGYKPLERRDWTSAGGYGKPFEHLLRQRIDG